MSAIPIIVPMPFFAELEKNNILESEQNPTVMTKDMYYVSNLYKIKLRQHMCVYMLMCACHYSY